MRNSCIIAILLLLVGTDTDARGDVNLSKYFGKNYAVVIGIQNYQNANTWPEVINAKHDADDMAAFFRDQGFGNVKIFIDAQATSHNILSYLEDNLAGSLRNDDRIIFYFSGHGETKNKWGYIIPYEGEKDRPSTWISMEKIREIAAKLGSARHQLFILDSCFGGMIEPKGSAVSSEDPFYLDELTKSRVRLYMTAGGANEKAPMDSSVSNNSHYTAYLLRGLNGLADKSHDGIITTSELMDYLRSAASIKGSLTPRWGTLDGHENAEFVFSSPKTKQVTIREPEVPIGPVKGTQPKQIDEDRHDWERLSALGANGLNSYLELQG
jgi:hypothetical protein